MKTTRRLTAMSLGLMLLASVAPGTALAQDDVETFAAEETEWHLASLSMDAVVNDVPEGVTVTLFLSGGEASGNAGCNSYFGTYEIDATALTFPDPFGVTRVLCQGPAQTVEDAYLPLLQATATWSVDEEGRLTLTDAAGVDTLIYREVPVVITASDIDRLAVALSELQAQIDTAETDIAALSEQAASVNLTKIRNRIAANEETSAANEAAIVEINKTIDKFRDRIKANEAAIVEINKTIDKFRNRIKALEATAEDHEDRITKLEDAAPVPEPSEG